MDPRISAVLETARLTAESSVMSTAIISIFELGKVLRREVSFGVDWEAGRMSKIIRFWRPCSRRAVAASKPRVPAPPVTLFCLISLIFERR